MYVSKPTHQFGDEDDIVYTLDNAGRITSCSEAWDRFAAANGGDRATAANVIGRNIFEFIPEVLARFYREKYDYARRTRQWVGFDYQCSTPTQFRLFHMAIHANFTGLMVVNSYVAGHPTNVEVSPDAGHDSAFTGLTGSVVICAHCRKTQRFDRPKEWEWVPRYVADPPATVRHELCPPCRAYFYSSGT